MHKNPIWLLFLSVVLVIVLVFTGTTLFKLYRFYSLSAQTQADVHQWTVKEIGSDFFVPNGHYTFQVGGHEIQGESPLLQPLYRNAWSVEEDFPKLQQQKWTVWYKPSNPHVSALQKKFPTKECISTGILWVLLIYFLGLGRYVAKHSGM